MIDPTVSSADASPVALLKSTIAGMLDGLIAAAPRIVIAGLIFVAFTFAARGVRLVVRRAFGHTAKENVGMVLGRLGYFATLLLGALVAITVVVPSMTPGRLVSLLGIGGVAIGFAFKDIFQNMVAGILLLWRQPFRITLTRPPTSPYVRRMGWVGLLAVLFGAVACGACGSNDEAAQMPATPVASTPDAPSAPAPSSPSTASPTPSGTTPTPGPVTPAGLACLASHFGGTAMMKGTGYVLRLPDGTDLPWDDGMTKTFDVAMETPDLQDMLSIPYRMGTIVPDNTLNLDPGRIRNETLFKAKFGASAAAVEAQLVTVDFVGQNVKFHPLAAAALTNVSTKLKALVATTPSLAAYLTGPLGGTYEWRPIANTTRLSAHSYGIAIDIVVAKSDYWEWEKAKDGTFVWKNAIPQAIVDAFESEGFAWGGRWYHFDTMHFEWRPELFDKACTAS